MKLNKFDENILIEEFSNIQSELLPGVKLVNDFKIENLVRKRRVRKIIKRS